MMSDFRIFMVLLTLCAGCTESPGSQTSMFGSRAVDLEIQVTGGLIRGISEDDVKQYHGIPYAAPPVGDLRWAPPAPVIPWEGVRDASEPGPICTQRTGVPIAFYAPVRPKPERSEDCLTLNVWTRAARGDEGRPVMVWIHGGGLGAGWGARSAGPLLAEKGAVLVSINYRLGRFGFLAHPELSAENPNGVSGNQGFRDQVQALEWVRDNIARFGGDPGNVTIFGESAGAISVAVMQASPMARGLFHRAIGQSTPAFFPMQHRTRDQSFVPSGESIGLQFGAALVGGQADQSLAALRNVPAATVLEVSESSPAFSGYDFLPTVDGEVLIEDLGTTFANGRQADVPVMVGWAAEEGAVAVPEFFMKAMGAGLQGFNTYGAALLPEVSDEIPDYYPASTDDDVLQYWQALFTDVSYTYPARVWVRSMGHLKSDAYLYSFTWPPTLTGGGNRDAFHGASQIYVHGDFDLFKELAPTDADRRFSEIIAETWVRFARTGNPNGGSLPDWPAFTRENEAYLELGATLRAGERLRMPQMDLIEKAWAERRAANEPPPERDAYFGDLHVHTGNSFDAFLFSTLATPDDAYRFAKGGTVKHVAGFDMTLKEPLDFYAVTDHAFLMGAMLAMKDPTNPLARHPDAKDLTSLATREDRIKAFRAAVQFVRPGSPRYREIDDPPTTQTTWADVVATANRHNDPGRFTTFIGYEWSSAPDQQNLHRNVIFKGSKAPVAPYSRFISSDPEDLWVWMDILREQGLESLAIPHNSNGSNGQMFSLNDFDGNPLDADYADRRVRNEPLVEITQVKGTSETHPALSPNDEWADFEIMPYLVSTSILGEVKGSYVRDAWLTGLNLQEQQGFDPFKFGVIGSSDSHNASSGGTEDDFWGKIGMVDGTAKIRGSVPMTPEDGEHELDPVVISWGSSGLAGVWAEENTRASIYEAMRRKEAFGTSGTRIKVRFFAGYDLPSIESRNLIGEAYTGGVPMGADLVSQVDQTPSFIVWALQDANSAPLQRVQIIKGWISKGAVQEKVFDVACSDGFVDPVTHRCPDNNAKVNVEDCSISGEGAGALKAAWHDPEFNPDQAAFYYVRALENPICRWSTWDAIRAGVEPREGIARTIQERAWSSPIWYLPK